MKFTVKKVPKFKIDFSFSSKQMADIAKDARTLMTRRTQSGKDIKDRTFKPYSLLYKKSGTPNLTDTGRMIGGLEVNSRKDYGKISITDVEQNNKGYYHQKGMGRLPKRKWFGLSPKDNNKLMDKTIRPMFRKKVKND